MNQIPIQPQKDPSEDSARPTQADRSADLRGVLPSLPADAQPSILPVTPSQEPLTARDIAALLTAQEQWEFAFSAVNDAIARHPNNLQTIQTTESEDWAEGEESELLSGETEEDASTRALEEARGALNPYKEFFTEWLTSDEFFALVTKVYPLPTEMPTNDSIVDQIDAVGGPAFYQKIRMMLEPQGSHPPKREDLNERLAKITCFVGWESATSSQSQSSIETAMQDQSLSLYDIKEIRESLVTMLVLINNMTNHILASSPSRLPLVADDETADQ